MTYEPLAVAADDPDARTAYLRAFDLMRSHDDDAISHFHALAERRPGDPLVRRHLTRLRAGLRGDEVELAEK
jgi:adenylate cyclase